MELFVLPELDANAKLPTADRMRMDNGLGLVGAGGADSDEAHGGPPPSYAPPLPRAGTDAADFKARHESDDAAGGWSGAVATGHATLLPKIGSLIYPPGVVPLGQ
jgi:hypothetical protein